MDPNQKPPMPPAPTPPNPVIPPPPPAPNQYQAKPFVSYAGQAQPVVSVAAQNQPMQQYYVPTVPVEPVSVHPGRTAGIFSIICAVVSLLFFPPIFGLIGIFLGIKSLNNGAKSLGIVGIVLSAIFMIVGMILGIIVNEALRTKGMMGGFLYPF